MGLTSSNTTPETFSIVYFVKSPGGVAQTGTSQIVTVNMSVLNPCVADTPDISNVLSGATLSYTVNDARHDVTVNESLAAQGITAPPTCPPLEWVLQNSDGTAHDAIFNLNTGGTNPIFETYTTDLSKVGSYNLKLIAKYTGLAYSNKVTLSFTMVVVDPCLSPTLTLTMPASTIIQYDYTGNNPLGTFQFASVSITPTTCSYYFTCSCSESTDLCSMNSSPSLSNFSPTTG